MVGTGMHVQGHTCTLGKCSAWATRQPCLYYCAWYPWLIRHVGIQSLETTSWKKFWVLNKIYILFPPQNLAKTWCHFELTKGLIFFEQFCIHSPKINLQNKVSHQENCSITILSFSRLLFTYFMSYKKLRWIGNFSWRSVAMLAPALRPSTSVLFSFLPHFYPTTPHLKSMKTQTSTHHWTCQIMLEVFPLHRVYFSRYQFLISPILYFFDVLFFF